MIKEYISYSEYWLYTNDQTRYYMQYVLGIREPANEAMRFGSIVHGAVAGECDVEEAMKKEFFTGDRIRVAKECVKNAKQVPVQELPIYIKGHKGNNLKCPVLMIYDGLDFNENLILERKTTKSGWANQEIVDDAEQLSWYSMGYFEMKEIYPIIELERLSSTNGKSKIFHTTRDEHDRLRVIENINSMYDELVSKGWWERRQISEDRAKNTIIARDNFKKYEYSSTSLGDNQE